MKVKAIISFNDLEENKHRNIGDVFECSKTRCDYLLEHNAIEIIEDGTLEHPFETILPEPTEEIKEEVKEEMPKKNKKKKSNKK